MNYEFFLDVDGTLTDGKMIYSKDGKQNKAFGPDDWNALEVIKDFMHLHFISADRKGFEITHRRIEEECGYDLDLVPGAGHQRWEHIKNNRLNKKAQILYMGDGILDWYPLIQANLGITTCDALEPIKKCADFVTTRPGGNRAVAEACLFISEKLQLGCFPFHDQ